MEDDFLTIEREKYNKLQTELMALEIEQMHCLDVKIGKVLDWSNERNIIQGSTLLAQYAKVVSEIGELGDALLKNNKDESEDAIGDAMVVLINIAAMCNTDLNTCLSKAYEQIKDRKGIMFNGAFVKETDANYERIVRHVKSESCQTDIFSKD